LRVISGEARGHHLKGPPSISTRPMADKIRGSLFSMQASLGVAPAFTIAIARTALPL